MCLSQKTPQSTHHRHGEAHSDHDHMMQDHEELAAQVSSDGWSHRFGLTLLLVIFDLKFVPVAQEHGIDVIDEVGNCKEDIAGGEPMPEGGETKDRKW